MHDGYYWEELPPMAIAREGIACSTVNLPMAADKTVEVGFLIGIYRPFKKNTTTKMKKINVSVSNNGCGWVSRQM